MKPATDRRLVRYGERRAQVAELWRPAGATGPVPVVVLFHGGFWRAVYTKRLMHRLASDVARRGWAAWNVEYRRVGLGGGGGGWPGTLEDAAAAVDHLRRLDGVDLARVAVCGHSAGGQLALWCAARDRLPAGAPGAVDAGGAGLRPLPVKVAVSLAGVVDLAAAAELGLGGQAVQAFLGGQPGERPERYALASPAELPPIGVDQLIVHGTADSVVPLAMSQRYAAGEGADGEQATLLTMPGVSHTGVIDRRGPGWAGVVTHLERAFAPSSP